MGENGSKRATAVVRKEERRRAKRGWQGRKSITTLLTLWARFLLRQPEPASSLGVVVCPVSAESGARRIIMHHGSTTTYSTSGARHYNGQRPTFEGAIGRLCLPSYRLQRHSLGLSTVRRCLSGGARVVASTSRLSASALALTALTLAVRSPLPSDKTQVQHAHHAVHLFSRYLLELAGLQPPLLWPQLEAHGAPQPPCTCTNYARCKQCRARMCLSAAAPSTTFCSGAPCAISSQCSHVAQPLSQTLYNPRQSHLDD